MGAKAGRAKFPDSTDERSSLIDRETEISGASWVENSLGRRLTQPRENAKKRFRSILICNFGMFVSSIVFSITISSLWPFLQISDTSANATFLGWIVASFSVGQLIASPVIGYIANRTDKNKPILIVSTALIAVSNIMYAYVESFTTSAISNKWWIMLARFIMGVGAANSTIMRSYAAAATTKAERTNTMANLSASQGIGFILGPLIQAMFAYIGYPGAVAKPWLHLNIYTAPAFFAAFLAFVNVLLFIFSFEDARVETSTKTNEEKKVVSTSERHDQSMALICCLYAFFVAYLTFTNYETIGSPLSIDMYAWTKAQSTRNNGYILGALGAMSVVVLLVTKYLAKKYQDRTLMLGGIIICFLGYFVFLPWGDDYPSVQIATVTQVQSTTSSYNANTTSYTTLFTSSTSSNSTPADDGIGCPLDYDWCYNVPRVQLFQYIAASVIITIGFTVGNVICYSIFSKKLGDRPQGTMMGFFTSAGSLARAFGPISVGFLYEHWGPRVMMIFMLVFVFSCIIAILANYSRLYIPPESADEPHEDKAAVEEEEPQGINSV